MNFQELAYKLAYIGDTAARKVARKATLAGAKVIAAKQKSSLPKFEYLRKNRKNIGALRRSIGARAMKAKEGKLGAKAGFDVGSKDIDKGLLDDAGNRRGSHGHLFILGTVKRSTGSKRDRRRGAKKGARILTGKAVRNRGIMPAHLPSFIAMASRAADAEALQAVATVTQAELAKEIQSQGL